MTESGWRKGVGWGWSWGDGDEVGALNGISPSSVLGALALVSEGRIYDLGLLVVGNC